MAISLQNLSIRQRIWILTGGALLGLVLISVLAINKAQQEFIELKQEQYENLTSVALKSIEYFYDAAQRGELTELEAKRMAREAVIAQALDDRIYFYLNHTEEMLIAHPYVTSIYPTDTPAQLNASLQTNREGKVTASERLGLDDPLIDTMTIIKETHPDDYTGFVDYYMYLHPDDGTAVIQRIEDDNIPDIAELKTAYAAHFSPWDWVVVSGIYREDEQASFLNWLISLASIAGSIIIIIGFMGWRISSSITGPLAKTVLLMKDISQGSGDLSRRLSIEGKNELVAFAESFNTFVEKISGIVQRVTRSNKQILNHARNLNHHMADSVTLSDSQLAETEMLASATNELSYSLSSVTEHAQITSDAATAAQQASRESKESMTANTTSIRKLSDTLTHTQQEVTSMQSFSDQVSSVLEVIVGIAEQTNLLALNAAIEAARAGEHGRGFAVVADEVRTLAQRTQHSTKEIHEIVSNLQSGTQRVVQAMNNGLRESEACVSTSDKSSIELQHIIEHIDKITSMNAEIATAVEQQSSTTQEIAQSSHKIADSSRDNLSSIEKNRTAIEEMNKELEEMSAQVAAFRTQ